MPQVQFEDATLSLPKMWLDPHNQAKQAEGVTNVKADSSTNAIEELRTCHKCRTGQLEIVDGAEINATPGRYFSGVPVVNGSEAFLFRGKVCATTSFSYVALIVLSLGHELDDSDCSLSQRRQADRKG
jgi:hypothetical protein